MTIRGLVPVVAGEPSVAAALRRLDEPGVSLLDLTAPAALRPFLAASIAADRTVLVVTATSREADELVEAARSLTDPETVVDFPAWETLPHERLSPRSDTVGRRLAVLRRLLHPGDARGQGPVRVVGAPARSVLQPQVRGLGDLEA